MQAKIEQKRQRLLGIAPDLPLHKLQLVVAPTAASLPALAVVALLLLLLATARRPCSFLDAYRSGVVSLPSPSRTSPPHLGRSAAANRVPSGCDIFRPGQWVPDDDAPYYTNLTCPLIQEHQNCMKYGRPDRGFLRWRWRPDGCDLPRFDAAAFLDAVRDTSLAFVGDSLARNHMQSLMCLLSKVAYPKDVSTTTNPEFRTMRYEAYNFTMAIFWSPFLVRGHQPDPRRHMWDIYLDEPDAAWRDAVSGFDRVVLSAATWFTRPAMFYEAGGGRVRVVGCHYCLVPGVPDRTLRYSLRMALRSALRVLTGPRFNGTVILRTLSPTSHFEGGEWDRGGDCRRTRPFAPNETRVAGLDLDLHAVQVEEFSRARAEAEASGGGTRLALMDTTAAMVLRPDGHPSRYGHWPHENVTLYNDCVHWCLPGPIDAWNDMLLQMLLADPS